MSDQATDRPVQRDAAAGIHDARETRLWAGVAGVSATAAIVAAMVAVAASGPPGAPPATASALAAVAAAAGPLRAHPANPRYFTDGSGRAIYLTGSHTWANLQERTLPPAPAFDFEGYLDFLTAQNHNFIRLWAWEQAQGAPWTPEPVRFHPLAFERPGPGTARDGNPQFDVSRFDPDYFARLRERVAAAGRRGIYVGVMLFQGWSIETKRKAGNPWPGHPFHRDNNVNGLDGDRNGDDEGHEAHELVDARVLAAQQAYVRKTIETLNDLDNVLWEISNESHVGSTAWQYEMIRFIKRHEATLPKQHPVGMTAQYPEGPNDVLFESPADWISPNHRPDAPYRTDPPPASGDKIVISDTDHLWGVGGDGVWVWKSFTRGLHTIYMDPYGADPSGRERRPSESARRAMGDTLRWSRRVNLVAMTPRPDLASSRFCLAAPGREYLVYLPVTRSVFVDLSGVTGRVTAEWFSPTTGETVDGGATGGGASRFFTSPFTRDSVLYLTTAAR